MVSLCCTLIYTLQLLFENVQKIQLNDCEKSHRKNTTIPQLNPVNIEPSEDQEALVLREHFIADVTVNISNILLLSRKKKDFIPVYLFV